MENNYKWIANNDGNTDQTNLLSLLDGGHGVWLELQLVRPTQFPVEDGNDDHDHEEGDHHPDDDPHVGVLGVGRGGQGLFYS